VDAFAFLNDEDIGLVQRVADWAARTQPEAFNERFLSELAVAEGIDFATALLYHQIVTSPLHGPFVRRIETMRRAARQNLRLAVAVVPGAFYREHPQTGADGKRLREAAAALGCATYLIPTQSVGRAEVNARMICDWLLACSEERIVLCSLSKGGADVKMALAEPDAADAFRNVVAWLNVGGTLRGSPMTTWLLRRPWFAAVYRWLFWLRGQDFRFVRELDRGAGCRLHRDAVPPSHIRTIHVVAFPLRRHIRDARTRRWHQRLSSFGPNDGAMVLTDACSLPGVILPVWGADHYFDSRWTPESIVAALLQYVDAELNQPMPAAEFASKS
jgi:hypothetical protein